MKQKFYFEAKDAAAVALEGWKVDTNPIAEREKLSSAGWIFATIYPAAIVYDITPGTGGMLTEFKRIATALESHGHHAAAAYLMKLCEIPHVKKAGRNERYCFNDDGMTAVYNGKPWTHSIDVRWNCNYWAITIAIAKDV